MTPRATRRAYLRRLGSAGAAAAALSLAGCGGGGGDDADVGGSADATAVTVEMTDELTYEPATVAVAVGGTVTWETVGTIGHTVTAYDAELPSAGAYFASGGFESERAARDAYPGRGNVPAGGTYEHTFETAGEHGYFCIPHERNGMVGTVRVG